MIMPSFRFAALLACVAWLGVSPGHAETLLVVRKSADALEMIDPGSGLRLASVAVGFAPHEVAVSPDGRLAAVTNYGTREKPGTTLSIVDLEQAREIRRIDLAPHTRPHGVDWYAPHRVAVTTEGSQSLLVVDPTEGRVLSASATGQEVSHMVDVTPDGRRAFVANIGSGSLTAIDLPDAGSVRTVQTGAGTEGVAVTPDGRQVWVLARAEGALVRLDAATLERLGGAALPGIPIRIVFDPKGSRAYVTRAGNADIVALDATSGLPITERKLDVRPARGAEERPMASIAPGSSLPIGVAVSRDGASVFVAATMGDAVLRLDARTLDVLGTIEVGGEPDGLALTPVLPKAHCHACAAAPDGQ
jgi:DNA-binding beta-propeller fold protein YncE